MRHKYTLFRRKGQKVWYFYFYEGNKRISKTTGKIKKYEAERYITDFFKEDRTYDIRLKEYAKDFFIWKKCSWIKRQHAKGRSFSESVAQSCRGHLTNYIFPNFGEKFLRILKRIDIEKWLISLDLSNQTKNHILYSFRIVLREAVLEGLISSNPLEQIEAMGNNAKKRDPFTPSEIRLLFPENRESLLKIWKTTKHAACFLIIASTGIRSGEVRALRWRHLLNGTALYIENAVKANNIIDKTKTDEVRVVLLPKYAQELLELWYSETPFKDKEDLIFFGMGADKPLNRKSLSYYLSQCIKRSGINTKGRKLVVHSFRHTFNTIMRKILPEEILRELTGHKSREMTDLYDHPTVDDRLKKLSKSRNLIESIWV